jgi:hypothetical protein
MAVRIHPLPLEVFEESARPFIKRLNDELRQLSGLEGTIRQPLAVRRSDRTVSRRGEQQVHVTRITPAVGQVVSGASSIIGTPALTLGQTNVAGTTNTALSVDSSLAIFDTGTPAGVSTGSAAGSQAFAARRDHVHSFDNILEEVASVATGPDAPKFAILLGPPDELYVRMRRTDGAYRWISIVAAP